MGTELALGYERNASHTTRADFITPDPAWCFDHSSGRVIFCGSTAGPKPTAYLYVLECLQHRTLQYSALDFPLVSKIPTSTTLQPRLASCIIFNDPPLSQRSGKYISSSPAHLRDPMWTTTTRTRFESSCWVPSKAGQEVHSVPIRWQRQRPAASELGAINQRIASPSKERHISKTFSQCLL